MDPAASQQALSQARAFFPRDEQVDQLQERINRLPEVSGLLREAVNYELAERYSDALIIYEQVTNVDSATKVLAERVAAAKLGLKKQRVRRLLGNGFRALEQSQFTSARSAFTAVLTEEPNNAAALGGIEQIGQLYDVAVIRKAESDAATAMAAGDWNEAVSAYERILELDPTIQIGITGRAAAIEHQRISNLIGAIQAQPERLSNSKLFNDAERAVAEAKALPYQTRAFIQTIEQVSTLLSQYRNPVSVTLISDNAIEISLSNVGNLGQLSERTLTLRPGTYTLRGSKDGCRDIYTEITVLPGIAPIEVSAPTIYRIRELGWQGQREEEYLDIATNDNEASVKLAFSHRSGLWDPWSLLAHLDVEPNYPAVRRLAQKPHRPADPEFLGS